MNTDANARAGGAPAAGPLVAAGNFLFHWRNLLVPFAFLLVLVPGPHIGADPIRATLAGFSIALLGQVCRAATIGYKYIVRGGRNRRVYAEDLVTEGIYAHVRNPMYVGNLLICVGVAFASNSWASLAIAILLFLFVYSAIIAAEENFLRARFGPAFDRYCADVPRWVPNLSGLGATMRGMQFRWGRVIVKEYGTPFGWVVGTCGLALWNLWEQGHSWAGDESRVRALQATIGAAVVLWLVAWSLKKTRTLTAD